LLLVVETKKIVYVHPDEGPVDRFVVVVNGNMLAGAKREQAPEEVREIVKRHQEAQRRPTYKEPER